MFESYQMTLNSYAAYGLAIVLSLLFLFFSSIKILGWQKRILEIQMGFMKSYGLSREQYRMIGVLEFSAVCTLWAQGMLQGLYGATAIFIASVGALYFHLKYDTVKDGVPAIVTGSLSGLLMFNNLEGIKAMLG